MEGYVSCGLRLGWLIDPETRTVYVYRPNVAVEELKDVAEVSADPELPGFVLDLRNVSIALRHLGEKFRLQEEARKLRGIYSDALRAASCSGEFIALGQANTCFR